MDREVVSPQVFAMLPVDIKNAARKRMKTELKKENILAQVCRVVGSVFNVDDEILKLKCRKREIVVPRQVAISIAHELFYKYYRVKGWVQIGKHFNVDHATAIHSYRTMRNLTDSRFGDPIIIDKYDKCCDILNDRFKTNL